MLRFTFLIAITAALVIGLPARAHHTELPAGMSEPEATWLWGYYTIPASITLDSSPYWYGYPHTLVEKINNPPWTDVAKKHIKPGAKAPAALVMHGCTGLARGPDGLRVFLMKQGFAIFQPDSFARPGRTCNQETISKRAEELAYALKMIKQLSWVDQDRIVLIGISQGGVAVAQWSAPGFRSHVVLAHDCNNARPMAPSETPVLTVIGENDDLHPGTNCKVNESAAGSKSIVIEGAGHSEVVDAPETLAALEIFLNL